MIVWAENVDGPCCRKSRRCLGLGLVDIDMGLQGVDQICADIRGDFDRVFNGLTRPFFGWISDQIGRENTMFVAFGLEGVGIYALSVFGQDPLMFVLLSGLVFFAWGEIYSLFPATVGDTFGSKFATTNSGLLYTAKGTASLVVPYTSILTAWTGSWHAVFLSAAALNIAAALIALFVLKPMRASYTRQAQIMQPAPAEEDGSETAPFRPELAFGSDN